MTSILLASLLLTASAQHHEPDEANKKFAPLHEKKVKKDSHPSGKIFVPTVKAKSVKGK